MLGFVLLIYIWSTLWTRVSLINTFEPWISGPNDQIFVVAKISQLNLFYKKLLNSVEFGLELISYF